MKEDDDEFDEWTKEYIWQMQNDIIDRLLSKNSEDNAPDYIFEYADLDAYDFSNSKLGRIRGIRRVGELKDIVQVDLEKPEEQESKLHFFEKDIVKTEDNRILLNTQEAV